MFTSIATLYGRAVRLLHKIDWAGSLLLRLTLGLAFAPNGWGKLRNLDGVTEYFDSLHVPAPHFNAMLVGSIELVGGVLLILGLGTRIASALLIGVMSVATLTAVVPKLDSGLDGVSQLANSIEMTYLAVFVWLLMKGAGTASLDHLIARRAPTEPRVGVAA